MASRVEATAIYRFWNGRYCTFILRTVFTSSPVDFTAFQMPEPHKCIDDVITKYCTTVHYVHCIIR
jgi:hypothetical protein